MKNMRILYPVLIPLVVLIGACSGGGDSEDTTTFSLNVTDMPVAGAKHVFVEFSAVTMQHENGDRLEFDFNPPKSIDLLALQGTASQPLLESVKIPAGQYEWIRLHVNAEFDSLMDSYIKLKDGGEHELRVPSGSQSGLKLNRPFTLIADTENIDLGGGSVFTIDFNLGKSIIRPRGQPGYFLKPVLTLVKDDETGGIAGTVDSGLFLGNGCDTDPDTGNAVYAYSGVSVRPDDIGSSTEPVAISMVALDAASGKYLYELGFLNAGSYTIAFTCMADQDFDAGDADDPDGNPDDDIAFQAATEVQVVAGAVSEKNLR